jgi:hypothetical protein
MRPTEPSHELAQHWRLVLKLQAIYVSGAVLESAAGMGVRLAITRN